LNADLTTHHIEGIARMGNKPFKVTLFSQIDRNLWTGGCPIVKAPEHFKFIVSLYPLEPYEIHGHQIVTQARLFDHGEMPDAEVLKVLADHVNRCVLVGPTLVHCQAGLNRSGLVAGLALIRMGMEPAEAIALLREKRCDAVLCNSAFEQWLRNQ
jgi:protein-tyrosine phosphatase